MPVYLDCETTSLDADIGILIAVGLILPEGREKIFFVSKPEEEKKVLEDLMKFLEDMKGEEVYVWNSSFDIPFLLSRAIKNDVDASILFQLKIIDLCKFCRENLKLSSNKLDEVSKFLGLNKNLKTTGKNMQEFYMAFLRGNTDKKEEIIKHCMDDVHRLKEVHERIKDYVEIWKRLNFRNNW